MRYEFNLLCLVCLCLYSLFSLSRCLLALGHTLGIAIAIYASSLLTLFLLLQDPSIWVLENVLLRTPLKGVESIHRHSPGDKLDCLLIRIMECSVEDQPFAHVNVV